MLAHSGLAKVMDFGLARMAGTEHLTNDGYMVGTPAYMSPEQVLAHEIDGRADLYAMGVVLFRMLTGQLPFKADSGIAMAQKQMYDQPTPVRQLRTELPPTAEDIITRALAKKPEDRFQTADEFKAALSMLSGFSSTETTRTLTSPIPRAPIRPRTDLPTMPPTLTPHLMAKPAAPGPVAAAPAPAPPGAARSRRVRLAALAAAAVLLVAAVPATIMISRGRAASGDAESVTAAAPSAGAVAKPSDSPAAPVPVPEPASVPAAAAVPEASPTRGSAPPVPAPRVAKADAPKRPRETPAGETPPPTPSPTPPPAPAAVVPTVAFTKLKLLVIDDGKARDRDASLRLGADAIHVMDGDTTISTTQYRDVIGLYHSHSREPKWVTPQGAGVSIAKVGGKFSFLKDTPDWVTVRTKAQFIPLRVPERDLARVVAELESRTGMKVIRPR
jgi:serine/threonine-protein kinase